MASQLLAPISLRQFTPSGASQCCGTCQRCSVPVHVPVHVPIRTGGFDDIEKAAAVSQKPYSSAIVWVVWVLIAVLGLYLSWYFLVGPWLQRRKQHRANRSAARLIAQEAAEKGKGKGPQGDKGRSGHPCVRTQAHTQPPGTIRQPLIASATGRAREQRGRRIEKAAAAPQPTSATSREEKAAPPPCVASRTSSTERSSIEDRQRAVLAQLRRDLRDTVAKEESLASSYAASVESHARATQRVNELTEAIQQLKEQTTTHNLTRDALMALGTSSAVRHFDERISTEEWRLVGLMERLDDMDKTRVLQQQHSSGGRDSLCVTQPSSASTEAPASESELVGDELGLTETELRRVLRSTNDHITQLDRDIARVQSQCESIQEQVRRLGKEKDGLSKQAATGLTAYRVSLVKTCADVDVFKREIEMALQQLRALGKETSKQEGILQQMEQTAAEQAMRDGTCVACLERPPSVVFFPCKQRCLCAGCWAKISHNHERAKREAERLRQAGRDDKAWPMYVRRDAELRCPACLTKAVFACDVEDIKATT
ncbi:unnamed protein product [Vitrella brassicaformis CCMP3155]|uniref:RING-type domain-containing protein n=2 Tax=Vitrella brassicaformis TaxID=1169539 RepID=A0A0G4GAF7_VITBC|nr:unnamed protein product [Vitrella brassicaformis CCMP3155]|eukprot:CEM25964.1 unnamed protein product [Vitrella brassicaformis CCMP3155]